MTDTSLRRRSIRLRLSLTYTALILATSTAILMLTFAVLAWAPGYQVVPSSLGMSHGRPVYEIRNKGDILTLFAASGVAALVVVGALGGVVSWIVAGRLLRPLDVIVHATTTLDDRRITDRVPVSVPLDEISEVAVTLNRMLDRIQNALEARERFAANASHELRTPLAATRTALQVALMKPSNVETTQLLKRLLATNDSMIATTEALLDLARGAPATREPVNLADIVQHVADLLRAESAAATVHLETQPARAVAAGDTDLLQQMTINLLRNAVVHNIPGGWVRASTQTRGSQALLVVENTGPYIEDEEAARLTEPFHRRSTRTPANPGHGLGLAIVEAIVRRHGGLLLIRPRSAGGLQIEVRLPVP